MSTRSSLSLPRRLAYGAWRAVPGPVRGAGETALRWRAERSVSGQPWFDGSTPHRLLIGPLNTAGQAQAWARAADRLPDVQALSLSAARRSAAASTFGYATDVHLDLPAQLRGMRPHRERVLGTGRSVGATAVLAESGYPVLGDFFRRTILEDLPALEAAGIRTALLIHGSEARDLHRHAEAYQHSPFRLDWDERWERMQASVEQTREIIEAFPGPVLVPTLDMLDVLPGATLLPITIDVDRFTGQPDLGGPLERDVPVVLHAPTNPRLKGTAVVEQILGRLDEEGLVEYRRLQGVPNRQMPQALSDADVIIDQIVLGNVATLAAEAMAAGRLVLAHVAPTVRDRARELDTLRENLPVVEADPATLEEVLRDVLARRDHYRAVAARGPAWARRHHDGTIAADILGSQFL